METYELRYFVAVAKTENIHRAATAMSVSPGSLSKAIARLETELGVKLFDRIRREIKLTSDGRLLQQRASTILQLEEAARIEIQGGRAGFQVRFAGPEILLARSGVGITREIRKRHAEAKFTFIPCTEADADRAVVNGDAHLGLTTADISSELSVKKLFRVSFKTCVGATHPLFKAAKSGKNLPISEVLGYDFVCPDKPIMGLVGKYQSTDGWRDDKFPRRIGYVADSLQLVQELVVSGNAVAYLPDYYVEQIQVATLSISDCPYSCNQTVKLFARDPKRTSWLNHLF